VNLGVPVDGLEQETTFLVELLGYRRVEAGPEAQAFGTLWWFEGDDGAQVHLSADPEHRPAARAHTAIRLDDALDPTLDRLRGAGHECGELAFDGDRLVYTHDPAGNTWELIGPVKETVKTPPAGSAKA
jgi:catechol 2,3-dioxygenase-like lactoylglutathione lyase family enzyme